MVKTTPKGPEQTAVKSAAVRNLDNDTRTRYRVQVGSFTKMEGGRFHIGVMRPDGSGERTLTESFLDEGPSWSPNGRVIIFNRGYPSTRAAAGKFKLFSVDLTGYNLREVTTPMDASDPAWSPLLPL